jgi:hypothetical protein
MNDSGRFNIQYSMTASLCHCYARVWTSWLPSATAKPKEGVPDKWLILGASQKTPTIACSVVLPIRGLSDGPGPPQGSVS